MRKKKPEEQEGIAEWMLTYSDLVTLLLTFFIMLFSMSTIDKQKYMEIASSLKSTFLHLSNDNFFDNRGDAIFSITQQDNAIDKEHQNKENDPAFKTAEELAAQAFREKQLDELKEELESTINDLGLNNLISIVEEKKSLILRFDSVLLFDTGSADIRQSSEGVLQKLGMAFKELDYEIIVQGHTDDRPINTQLFPSNWELSTKRATNVVIFLVNKCGLDPGKLSAQGHAEFKPIRPNDTEANREKNRRIDIVVDKYDRK